MNDLLYAGISAAAGLTGAGIGAWATLRGSQVVFERQTTREELAWREGLHHECVFNIRLAQETPLDVRWTFGTHFLSGAFAHAGAFTEDELERISWTRIRNWRLLDAINGQLGPDATDALREAALAEISALEVMLRSPKPAQLRHRRLGHFGLKGHRRHPYPSPASSGP